MIRIVFTADNHLNRPTICQRIKADKRIARALYPLIRFPNPLTAFYYDPHRLYR